MKENTTMKRIRHYCKKCGLTWFDNSENSKCPDCHPKMKAKPMDDREIQKGRANQV